MTKLLLKKPLRQIARAVDSGSVDPTELTQTSLRLAGQNAHLNMFTALRDGPGETGKGLLAGIPYGAKDAIMTVSLPACAASPALQDLNCQEDAKAIRLIDEAGASLIGKTNMHELSFGVTSNNAAYGAVGNPLAHGRIAGGSSGGSAAAVASGTVAFALAADTGGSARIPAALCGVVGFRPTTGRWPDKGLLKVSPTRDSLGLICRNADDALLVDTVLTGDAVCHVMPDMAKLRFALLTEPYMQDVNDDVLKVVRRFLKSLKDAGGTTEHHSGRDLFEFEEQCGFMIALTEAKQQLIGLARSTGCDLAGFSKKISSPDVRTIVSSLNDFDEPDAYQRAMGDTRPALQQAYRTIFNQGADIIMMPTTPLTAAPIGQDETVNLRGRQVPTFSTYARHTAPASVAGVPSVSIPIGFTDEGLPVGLMLEAPAGQDRRLLTIAQVLSDICPISMAV